MGVARGSYTEDVPATVLEALKELEGTVNAALYFLALKQEETTVQLSRIADALEGNSASESDLGEGVALMEEEREQVGNLVVLLRRERTLQSNVLPYFEELIETGSVDVGHFLEAHDELPFQVTEDEKTGLLSSRGLMVAVGRAAAVATGERAPASYQKLGYYEEEGEDGQTIAMIEPRVARAVRELI